MSYYHYPFNRCAIFLLTNKPIRCRGFLKFIWTRQADYYQGHRQTLELT